MRALRTLLCPRGLPDCMIRGCLRGYLIEVVVMMVLCLSQLSLGYAQDNHHQHHSAASATLAEQTRPGNPLTIPDVTLVNQDGQPVNFYRDLVKDKVVAMNFIFTTCTTICSPMGANFAQFQALMGDRVGRDVHLISISVDPVIDTPQRLKAWGQKFQAGPGWTLLTGSKHQVNTLLKALGVFTADKWSHAPLVLVGNEATGRWTRANGLIPPKQLAQILKTLDTFVGADMPLSQEAH